MKILVTTPAGNIGRRVLRELLAPEFSLRVLTRESERLAPEVRQQAEIFRGSTDDLESLLRALDGVDAVFWCIPTEPWQVSDLHAHYVRHAYTGCRALQQAGTPRVVAISAGICRPAPDAGRFSPLPAIEDLLACSSTAIRHLRCGFLMESILSQAESIRRHGVISYPLPANVKVPMVAASDVADLALRWLVRRDWTGAEEVAVRGPEDLSYREAASVIEQALQRPVRYREASANEYIQTLVGMGASVEYARGQVNMFAALAHGANRAEPGTREFATPTTLATWTGNELTPGFQPLPAPEEVEAEAAMG